MGRLQDKVAVITGGSSGIGLRTVERFVEEGAFVVMGARRVDQGQKLAKSVGKRMTFLRTDVAKEADVQALIGLAVEKHGRLDCLFNNAGVVGPLGPIENVPLKEAENAMSILFGGVLLGIKYAAPIMKAQRSGSIINCGSIAGSRTGYGGTIYSSAKAAVIHLSKCTAMELGEHNVRVNSLSPGAILTGIFGKAIGLDDGEADATAQKLSDRFAKNQPIPRAGLPDDIANAAVYLASDESSFVNGQDIVVDGGLVGGRQWSAQMEGSKKMIAILGATKP